MSFICKSYRFDYHRPPAEKPSTTCPSKWNYIEGNCYMVSEKLNVLRQFVSKLFDRYDRTLSLADSYNLVLDSQLDLFELHRH